MITERLLGDIPELWKNVRLKQSLTILRNGLTVTQDNNGKGYPVTRIETISEEKIDPNKVGYVSRLSERDVNRYKLVEGDILFSHINSLEHIGKTAIYEGTPRILIHGMNLLLLRPNRNKVYPEYLLYLLKIFRMRGIFRVIAKKAVNQASINQTELGRLKILIPPLSEQQKIAHILSSVDNAILRVAKSIANTEQLKKGLMQKLLTEGIRHKEFKETKIGKIPKEWKVVRLRDLLVECYRYPTYYNIEYVNKGVPEIRGELLLDDGQIETDLTKFRFIKEKTAKRFPKVMLEKEDIVLSVRGTMGKIGYVPKDLEGAVITANLMRLSPNRQKIYPKFFMQYLLSMKFRQRLRALSTYTTIRTIQSRVLKSIRIPLPPIREQQEIAQILSTINERLGLDRKRKEKFERVKMGLMNDLLTGRRRVKVAM